MRNGWFIRPKAILLSLALLVLGIVIACGSSATTAVPTAAPAATAVPPAATQAPAATAVPPAATQAPAATAVPRPTATRAPAATVATVKPAGSLRIAFKEIGAYQGHPSLTGHPQYALVQLAAFEGMFGRDPQGDFFPKLVDSWTVSDDQLTWTFKLEKGVPFHGGWGEMTADDVIWSINEFAAEGSQSGTASDIKRLWQCPDCHVKALDDYTIEVNTGKPGFDMLNRIHAPNAGGTWVISKKQVDELGADEANIQAAGTGPWEMTENSTDDFWKFRAVVDHWRKTPEFGELTFFSIPEEATRVASFQTGNIDTFGAAPDSVPALAQVPGTKFMSQAGSSQSSLLIYGMWHEGVGTPDEAPGYDPDAPYISSNPDTSSPEWEQARKVRLAMGLAIDREKIIKELLRGEGKPLSMFGWATHESREDPDWKWEYDPERARQLLKEAGYEDGFEVGLTPAIRNAPGEVEACEAVGAMWQDVGITARIQSIPFGTLVQGQLTRTNTGIVCHASQPFTEPLVIYSSLYDPTGNWSSGTDHPFLTPLLSKANETFDTEERWALQKEMASFIWDNTFSIGLYQVNSIYPLGPNLDSWAEHLETGDPRRISSLEFAPHRK